MITEMFQKTLTAKYKSLSVCDNFSLSDDKTAETTAVPISSISSAATVGYNCKDSTQLLVLLFCA
jgi:hypothetical protein